ncbi:MAG: tRNA epoxyqueuosine(34) reductase QueG [Myxococcota bacterium]
MDSGGPDMPTDLRITLLAAAARLGFGRVRVALAGPPPNFDRYDAFLAAGHHAEMKWLEASRDKRSDARQMLPEARSVVVLAMDYAQRAPPDPGGLTGRVASYAWGRDYHALIGLRVRHLRRALEAAHPGLQTWGAVDSAPAWERGWAEAAGLGFNGKNGLAIVPGEGSYFFLATILLSEALEPDAPVTERCGRCRRCLDACPTAALLEGGGMDAARCISYLTIEHDGPIPEALRPQMGRWVFGCDDCQTVCPHQHPGKGPVPEDFAPRRAWLPLPAILEATDTALVDTFEGSPLRRAAPRRIRRSACVVLGNIGDPRARAVLSRVRDGDDAMLAEHAEWALARLSS